MPELVEMAGDLLGDRLELVESLSPGGSRNTVVRTRVVSGRLAGQLLVVKQTVGFHGPQAEDDARRRFYQEAVASVFLTRLAPGDHLPVCRGVDPQRGLMIFDDLGSGIDLATVLLGDDRSSAEHALHAYVHRLGALHAATARRMEEWDIVVAELGAPAELLRDQALQEYSDSLDRGIGGLDEQLRSLDLPGLDVAVREELEAVRAAMAATDEFTVLVHRDSCPDNVLITSDGARLIDFEAARPGHALLDGLYPQLPFPTCWCCNRLPRGLSDRLEAAYRSKLTSGIPAAADDTVYNSAVAYVMGFWLVSSFDWVFGGTLTDARTWGIASTRSRELSRLQSFVAQATRAEMLPRLRGVCERLLGALRRRWTTDDPLPLYPAFS